MIKPEMPNTIKKSYFAFIWMVGEQCHQPAQTKSTAIQKKLYRPSLIFWIVMGCGTAGFGRKGQKKTKIENFGLKV